MFKSRKMKRKQSKVRESHVLKAKGRKWFKKETPLHLKRDDRSSKMRTENVSVSGWQYESHLGNLNKLISEE
jgi:hypothetical protein